MYEDILSNLIIKNIRSIATSYSGKNASGKRTKRERWSIIIKTEGETHYYSNGETFGFGLPEGVRVYVERRSLFDGTGVLACPFKRHKKRWAVAKRFFKSS